MADPPDEAKELRLVNNVELKIALADTDPKLQKLLNIYLPPLLLKLASPHPAVRNKVVAVCQHVNTRVKPSDIRLPIADLLTQFKDSAIGGVHPLIRNFDLLYINIGVDRISVEEKLGLLPLLIKDISRVATTHQARLFNVLLRILLHFTPPPRGDAKDVALRTKLGLDQHPEDAVWLARWFGKLLLLGLNYAAATKPSPGLTIEDEQFLLVHGRKDTYSSVSSLVEIKRAAFKLLASGAFEDRERFLPILIASTVADSAISDPAQDAFKRCSASVSLEDESRIDELYELFLGDSPSSTTAPSHEYKLRVKIVELLSKSQAAVAEGRRKHIEVLFEIGLNSPKKLCETIFRFIFWVSRMGSDLLIQAISPALVEKMRTWIPEPNSETRVSDDMRENAYNALALLASRTPSMILEPSLDIVRFLFRKVDEEPGSVSTRVESCMDVLLGKLSRERINDDIRISLEDLFLELLFKENKSARQAVRWAGRLLGFSNAFGRWIGVVAVAMEDTKIADEGGNALHPYYYRLMNPQEAVARIADYHMDVDGLEAEDKYAFPEFLQLMRSFFATARSLPPSLRRRKPVDEKLPPKAFLAALSLTKRIAVWEALGTRSDNIKIDEDWGRNLDSIIQTDEDTQQRVEEYFAGVLRSEGKDELIMLLDKSWLGAVFEGDGLDDIRGAWYELAVLVPDQVTGRYISDLPKVRRLLSSTNALVRRAAALVFGLLVSHPETDSIAVGQIIKSLVTEAQRNATGHVLALGFVLSRLKLRGRLADIDHDLVKQSVTTVADAIVRSRDIGITEAAIEALTELAAFSVMTPDITCYDEIRCKLVERAKRGDKTAIIALGNLASIYSEHAAETGQLREELVKLGDEGGVEQSFVVGEALSNLAGGWTSIALRRGRRIAGTEWKEGFRSGVGALLDLLLKRASEPGGGGRRRTTVVGLLSVLELCGGDPEAKARLRDAQAAFRSFLTDREEFIQESAARGLSVVHERSDEDTRKDLVQSLVSSFTGEAPKLQVSMDTQLFEPGALPTGEGKSPGSYGDIMSLAAEAGDPSLVYKFMSLARHNSVWASREAFGRFGISSILSSSDEVKNNKKLWPILYRYRFDPSPGVRRSMDAIWSALGGGADTVERWWSAIIVECLKGAVKGSEWRVREASLRALAELLSGRKVSQYKDQLEDIWEIAFKLLDDIKESVRNAAMKLCRVLTTSMVKVVEGNVGPKDKQEILGILMDFLTGKQGLEAEAEEVQLFALDAIIEVIKNGGEAIRPWIPHVVEHLLAFLSDMESGAMNYLIMNADKYNTTGDDIDRLRLGAVGTSPVMTALEGVLDNLDPETTAKLIPRLIKSMRTSLGLPSKVGCGRVIVSLVMKRPAVFRPYADDMVAPLLSAVKDRSEVVSRSYAVAAGYLCRVTSGQGMLQIVNWAQRSYWEGEERDRRIAGVVIGALYKHATDQANEYAADILPFVFIAKNDIDESVKGEFAQTWGENTGGSGTIKLYMKEIVDAAVSRLSSPRWATKQTSAFALADAAKSIGASEMTRPQAEVLWNALVTAVAGKTWSGKERVLEAFVLFAVQAKAFISDDQSKLEEMEKIVVREANRRNIVYRVSALKSFGIFADGFEKPDLFNKAYEIVGAIISVEEDDMDVDVDNGQSMREVHHSGLMNGLCSLSQAFRPMSHSNENRALEELGKLLDLLGKHITGGGNDLKACSVDVLNRLVERLVAAKHVLIGGAWTEVLYRIWAKVLGHLQDRNYADGRTRAASLLQPLAIVLTEYRSRRGQESGFVRLRERIRTDVQRALNEEPSPIVLQILRTTAARLLEALG